MQAARTEKMERTRFFDDLPFLSGRSKKGGEKGPVAVQNYNKCVELSSNTPVRQSVEFFLQPQRPPSFTQQLVTNQLELPSKLMLIPSLVILESQALDLARKFGDLVRG